MFKLVLAILIIISFSSCGVDTSSSSHGTVNPNPPDPDPPGPDPDPPDPDPPGPDPDPPDDCDKDSVFDCKDAVLDPNACNASKYRLASDASYQGTRKGENGASLFQISGQGLWIGSDHLEAEAVDRAKTWVTLFYKSFPDPMLLNVQGSTSYRMDGVFFLSYDVAWSDESIPSLDNTVYVQSANGIKPSCYRAILNSVSGSDINITKVYR